MQQFPVMDMKHAWEKYLCYFMPLRFGCYCSITKPVLHDTEKWQWGLSDVAAGSENKKAFWHFLVTLKQKYAEPLILFLSIFPGSSSVWSLGYIHIQDQCSEQHNLKPQSHEQSTCLLIVEWVNMLWYIKTRCTTKQMNELSWIKIQ